MKSYLNSILLILLSVVTLTGCESSTESKGRKLYKEYMFKTLKNPSSFTVLEEIYEKDDSDYRVAWYLDYTATNSYGGVLRERTYLITTNNTLDVYKIDKYSNPKEILTDLLNWKYGEEYKVDTYMNFSH